MMDHKYPIVKLLQGTPLDKFKTSNFIPDRTFYSGKDL